MVLAYPGLGHPNVFFSSRVYGGRKKMEPDMIIFHGILSPSIKN